MNQNDLLALLHGTEIFSDFPPDVLKELLLHSEEHKAVKNQPILHKGDEGNAMYIIAEGIVRIHDDEHTVATMTHGNFFGEFSLLDAAPRSMSVSASTDVELIAINRESFFSVLQHHPELTKQIIAQLTKKMRKQNDVIISQFKTKERELSALVNERTAELQKRNIEITEKNKEILDSIQYAKRLQEAILPPSKFVKKYLKDSFVLYLPKDIISGDFYWISAVNDKMILMAAADCTGHGVPGALMSMMGVSLLNQLVNEKGITTPSAVLNQLHEAVITALKQNENDSNDGMDIALCCFDFEKNEVQFAGANRPLWLVRNNEIQIITPDKVPVGGLQIQRSEPFLNHTLSIIKNDTLYFFTDGYADQFGGEQGKKLMSKKLKELLISVQSLPMQEQEILLKSYFNEWKGNNEQVDDVLVIGVRI